MRRDVFLTTGAALAIAACARTAPPRDLRIGMVAERLAIDPYRFPAPETVQLAFAIGQPLLGVAEAQIAVDETTVTYRFHDAVRWHDGAPCGPNDLLEVMESVRRYPQLARAEPFANVADLGVRGRACIVRLRRPDRTFADRFFTDVGTVALPFLRVRGDQVLGTGPYALETMRDDVMELRRLRGTGATRVRFRGFADSRVALLALRGDEVDAVVPVDRTLVDRNRTRLVARRSGALTLIANVERLPSASRRAAIFGAIDAAAIAEKIYRVRPTTVLAPGIDLTGVAAPGAPLGALEIAVASTPVQLAVAALVEEQLRARGVRVRLAPWPLHAYGTILRDGHFDLAIDGGEYASLDDIGDAFRCDRRAPGGANVSRICDPVLDTAFATTNTAAAARALRRDHVVTVLAPYDDLAALSPRVSMPQPRRPYAPWFSDLASWSIS